MKLANYMKSKDYAAGRNLTFIDFSIFELLDYMDVYSKGRTLEKHANLKAYHERMTSLPRFSDAWRDETKLMKRPFKYYDRLQTDL